MNFRVCAPLFFCVQVCKLSWGIRSAINPFVAKICFSNNRTRNYTGLSGYLRRTNSLCTRVRIRYLCWLAQVSCLVSRERTKKDPFHHSYETALDKATLSTLSDRRAISCIKFISKVRPGNPLYPLIHKRVVPTSTSVCLLRSGSSSRPMATRTERFSNFVSIKYQSCQ